MASSLPSEHQREREWLTEMDGFDRATLHHDLLRLWGLGGDLGQRGDSGRMVPHLPHRPQLLSSFYENKFSGWIRALHHYDKISIVSSNLYILKEPVSVH